MPTWRSFKEVLRSELRDPETAREWRRTGIARAFSLWILKHRATHRLSQAALGHKLRMHQQVISRYQAGETNPRIDTLLDLSEALGLSFIITIGPDVCTMRIVDPTLPRSVESD